MKKFFAILLAMLMAFTSISSAFAAGSLQNQRCFKPSYEITEIKRKVTYDDIAFAIPAIEERFGSNYALFDAFKTQIDKKQNVIVEFYSPFIYNNCDYMMILVNPTNKYFLDPIPLMQSNMQPIKKYYTEVGPSEEVYQRFVLVYPDNDNTLFFNFNNVKPGNYYTFLIGQIK